MSEFGTNRVGRVSSCEQNVEIMRLPYRLAWVSAAFLPDLDIPDRGLKRIVGLSQIR
ncbi:Hypothetical protein AAM4_1666 [Actinomyces succiniciruminis]|uniref:Uncharacterized protein n=1 Tax=Actinomyces succiniciruminis TaxID=1522002 RepID=A0A1L7RPP6_9ACTO|nr:Hypothetical protein AAM4_1666 [Actinomyces succiniciruminis]